MVFALIFPSFNFCFAPHMFLAQIALVYWSPIYFPSIALLPFSFPSSSLPSYFLAILFPSSLVHCPSYSFPIYSYYLSLLFSYSLSFLYCSPFPFPCSFVSFSYTLPSLFLSYFFDQIIPWFSHRSGCFSVLPVP